MKQSKSERILADGERQNAGVIENGLEALRAKPNDVRAELKLFSRLADKVIENNDHVYKGIENDRKLSNQAIGNYVRAVDYWVLKKLISYRHSRLSTGLLNGHHDVAKLYNDVYERLDGDIDRFAGLALLNTDTIVVPLD